MTETTMPSRTSRRQKNSRKSRGALMFLRDILIIFLVAVLASVLIKTFLVRSFYIPSGSMEQTLHVNDRIIVNQLVPDLVPIERGDVVVFKDPGGWLTPQGEPVQNGVEKAVDAVLGFIGLTAPDSNDHLIKRVIGLPGDTVTCCNDFGQMSVNGVPLDEPYVNLPGGANRVSAIDFDVTVPEGFLWVMGDTATTPATPATTRTARARASSRSTTWSAVPC